MADSTRDCKIDPILISILLATTIGGVASISAAAVFSFGVLSKMVERLVSLSRMELPPFRRDCRSRRRPGGSTELRQRPGRTW